VIESIELRPANGCDARALERIAELDSARVPAGRLLVAESGGALMAAISMDTGETIADPFSPTAHLVAALRLAALRADGARAREERAWTRPHPQPAT
jgi:hypothetical protein